MNNSDFQKVLRRSQNISTFREKYRPIINQGYDNNLQLLPSIDKADLQTGFDELAQLVRNEGLRTYLFSSGGTTARPLLSLIPCHMFIRDIIQHWHPLNQEDVLCNLYTPGRMWSAHYFYNALGEYCAAQTIAFGPLQHEEVHTWLDFFEKHHVTALAGTPTTLKHILAACNSRHRSLAFIQKLLWVGEAIDAELAQLLHTVTPQAQTWGLYGSTETWVMGYNFPECPFDTFHMLPYQYSEIIQERLLITNLHPDCANILLRYKVGDRAKWAECSCGNTSTTIQVLGRNDDSFKLLGTILSPQEILYNVSLFAKPLKAQMAILQKPQGEIYLEVRIVPHPSQEIDTNFVRQQLLETFYDLKYAVSDKPDCFSVALVSDIYVNHRTHKTPLVVQENVYDNE